MWLHCAHRRAPCCACIVQFNFLFDLASPYVSDTYCINFHSPSLDLSLNRRIEERALHSDFIRTGRHEWGCDYLGTGYVCYGQSISVEIMMSFIEMLNGDVKKAIRPVSIEGGEIWLYYVWRGAVVIVSGYFLTWKMFQHMKCLQFTDNAFFMSTKRIPWFRCHCEVRKKSGEKEKNIEKDITLSLVCSSARSIDGWTNRVRLKIFIVSLSGSCEPMRTLPMIKRRINWTFCDIDGGAHGCCRFTFCQSYRHFSFVN